MGAKSISFRDSAIGSLTDLLNETGLDDNFVHKEIFNLVERLKHYTDEGRRFQPKIYIINKEDSIKSFEASVTHKSLGKMDKKEGSFYKILKYCAPLTGRGWSIYIYVEKTEICYGVSWVGDYVMRFSPEEPIKGTNAIVMYSVIDNTICFNNGKDSSLLMHFSTIRDSEFQPFENPDKFIRAAVNEVGEVCKENVSHALKNIVYSAIADRHGFIAAIIKDKGALQKLVDDNKLNSILILDKEVDLEEVMSTYSNSQLAKNLVDVMSMLNLVKGMMSMDGITFFTTSGKVIGYYGFVNVEGVNQSSGGARSRAFDMLKKMIQAGDVKAALKQSQDGQTEFCI